MDPVDAYSINTMKADWTDSAHNFGFDISEKIAIVSTDEKTIIYPLKIIGTVSSHPETGIDSVCWAWDDHPNSFPPDVVYDGEMRDRLRNIEYENREELFALVLREAIDQPGIIHRMFLSNNPNVDRDMFILFYLPTKR